MLDDNALYQQELEQYPVEELLDIAENINREKAPERFRMVVAEIKKRQHEPTPERMIDMQERADERPTGIAILSWLHLIGGVLGSVAIVFLAVVMQQTPEARQGLNMLGIPPVLIVLGAAFILVLGVASGIGMWKGKAWGWYLGSFYYMYGIARNLNALVMIPSLMNVFDPADLGRGPSYYVIKHGSRIFIHFLLYLYFFKGNVRAFFRLTAQKKWRTIVLQIGICLGIAILVTVLRHLMT